MQEIEETRERVRNHTEYFQEIARSVHEAARMRAAHRYFQRTTYRRPFRAEDIATER